MEIEDIQLLAQTWAREKIDDLVVFLSIIFNDGIEKNDISYLEIYDILILVLRLRGDEEEILACM